MQALEYSSSTFTAFENYPHFIVKKAEFSKFLLAKKPHETLSEPSDNKLSISESKQSVTSTPVKKRHHHKSLQHIQSNWQFNESCLKQNVSLPDNIDAEGGQAHALSDSISQPSSMENITLDSEESDVKNQINLSKESFEKTYVHFCFFYISLFYCPNKRCSTS